MAMILPPPSMLNVAPALQIDDPDKQRKWEEREQRRQMKRRAPKMKQLKVVV